MNNEQIINSLKNLQDKKVRDLKGEDKKLFFAIMRIADERDEYIIKYKNKVSEIEQYYIKIQSILDYYNNYKQLPIDFDITLKEILSNIEECGD